jgi:PAS domain S-box-containing protein
MSETRSFEAPPGDDFVYLAAFQQLVLERSHDLITVTDPLGTVVYASPSWHTVLGWDPETLLGRPGIELVHPDDHVRAGAAMRVALAGGEVEGITIRLRSRAGSWLAIEASGSAINDAEGNIAYLLGTARDVSEREELRNRVREIDALYRIADAIARTTQLGDLFDEAVEMLLDATDADRASILLSDEEQTMRYIAWSGLSDEYRAATEGHTPWTPDAEDPEPVLVPDAHDSGFDPALEAAVLREGIGALAFIPLVHNGRLLGKFMLYRDAAHAWLDGEVRLCRTIANHLASATVRTRARTALRDSREQLETIMSTVDEGIVVQSAAGAVVYANDSAARVIGFENAGDFLAADREAVLGSFEMLDEEGCPLAPDDLPGRRALRGETSERVIRWRNKKTGEERWSVVRANAVQDTQGGVARSVSVIRDVTESKIVERRVGFLTRAGELLNATLDVEHTLGALAAVAVPEFAGHVTVDLYEEGVLRCVGARHVDPAKAELMIELRRDYPPTVPEHPVQRAIATGEPQFVADVQAEAESMAHDERHARAIHELGNTSGIVVPLAARGRTFGAITFGTVPPQAQFTSSDLELAVEIGRRASAALDNALLFAEAQARARATEALEFVDDGVLLVDRGEIVRLLNPAAARAFAIKPTKAIGRRIDDVVRDWQTVRDRTAGTPAPQSGPRRPELLPVEVKGSERWLSISAVPFPGGTVYAFRDMTEERAVEQLKSDFVSTVSHELRTPLAAIYGAALTLQRGDIQLEESQRSGLLDVISSEADRLARIVNDILWASRLDSGQMSIAIESCDAAALATGVVDAVRAHAPSSIVLSVEAATAPPPVAADPDKLRQVLTNLVDNAVKYSPDGGGVRISLSRSGNRLRIHVTDEGLGVPLGEQERIFEKFFRLDPNLTRGVGGTGLGLYICRELVHRMHGRIWLVSDGRRGSTFTVELPLARS